jgi:hypothetical protein
VSKVGIRQRSPQGLGSSMKFTIKKVSGAPCNDVNGAVLKNRLYEC